MFRTLSLALLLTAFAMPAMAQSASTTTYNTQRTTTTNTTYSGGGRSYGTNTAYQDNSVSVIPTLKLGAGSYDTFQDDGEGAVALKAELHSTIRPWDSWHSLHPFIGVDTTNHGGYYANAGLAGDIAITPNVLLTPSLAAGYYEEGGAKDIGTNFALRPGLELAYRFNNESKVGLEVTSTMGVSSDDDSYEAVTLNYHMPFGMFDY